MNFEFVLQISEWMSDRRCFRLAPKDAADRLELLTRVNGIDVAEMYFDGLADNLRTYHTYGAMLHSYVRRKDVEKAEAIMQKMKELKMLRMAKYSFPYNNMIFLYHQIGAYDKIDQLVHDMKNQRVRWNINTVRNLLRAYAAVSDITKMEKLLNDINEYPELKSGWQELSIVANGYLEAGFTDKAVEILYELERTIPASGNRFAAQYLITHFASIGYKTDVYRIWYQNKPLSKQLNTYTICMISALTKLDDIDGAEAIFKEWESECDQYDFKVVNQLLNVYCVKGLVDKANSVLENKLAQGKEPCSTTWRILAGGYTLQKRMPEAIEMFRKAVLCDHQDWTHKSLSEMRVCLDYLEEQDDLEGLAEMMRFYRCL